MHEGGFLIASDNKENNPPAGKSPRHFCSELTRCAVRCLLVVVVVAAYEVEGGAEDESLMHRRRCLSMNHRSP